MHRYASQSMEAYGEQYILIETDKELGLTLHFRKAPDYKREIIIDSMRWEYRLESRLARVDNEECEISNIKWQIIIEKTI
jgi:hypothetical protein